MTNPSLGDFSLIQGSPLIDTCNPVGILTDFYDNPRPSTNCDIGSAEYVGGGALPTAPADLRITRR